MCRKLTLYKCCQKYRLSKNLHGQANASGANKAGKESNTSHENKNSENLFHGDGTFINLPSMWIVAATGVERISENSATCMSNPSMVTQPNK